MKDNFNYWVKSANKTFLFIYWVQFIAIYFLAITLSVKTRNPLAFVFLGFYPYLIIRFYLWIRSPFSTLEEGIKNYDFTLYERLSQNIPEKYIKLKKKRAASLLLFLSKEPDHSLNTNILSFKRNFRRITNSAMLSLLLWFITSFILGIYLYVA